MPVKISPIKILSDLGYEMVDIETDEDYLSALMESIVSLQGVGASGRERADILQEELIRVRKERKKAAPSAGMKATKKTISPSKFFDKKEKKPDAEGKGGAIIKIGNSVTSIVETLKEEQKQDKKQQSFLQKIAERFKRRKKENKLEFKVFDGLKKTATKLLAPMKNAWNEFLGFIGKVILGRVLFKILEWMGDKENQGKLKSIIKFFEDWWPAMLAGYLLFGNSLTSMVTGMLITMGKWLAPMLLAIGKLMLNPWVLAGLGLGAGIYAIGKTIGKDKEGENIAESQNQSREAIVDEGNMDEGEADVLSQSVTTENVDRMTQGDTNIRSNNNMLQTGMDDPLGGGRFGLNKGGTVPGSGNTDTVPAMLTPGEFVMSKGAVQKYGANTLAVMNAAAGGTNKPTLMSGFDEGGVVTDPEERKQQEAYMLKFVNEERALQGLEPLYDLTYAPGVQLTKMRGPGPRTKETSDTFTDLNRGIETTSTSKTVDGKTTFGASMRQTTEKDRQKFFAENPQAAQLVMLKNQMELDDLGDSITASARMNGGGLVQAFQGGGQVRGLQMGRSAAKNRANITPRKTATVITPSEKKKVTVAYQEEKQSMENNSNAEKSSQEIPQFDVTLGRSSKKIKVLGISV